jgi:hypothetical protein
LQHLQRMVAVSGEVVKIWDLTSFQCCQTFVLPEKVATRLLHKPCAEVQYIEVPLSTRPEDTELPLSTRPGVNRAALKY